MMQGTGARAEMPAAAKGDIRTAPTREMLPDKVSYEEFLAWCDEDTWAEWVDGEVKVLSPAAKEHQDIQGFLYELLRRYVAVHDLGVVIQAPFQMKTGPELPGREPDILFVARAHQDRLQETYLDGPADLVIEVVSSESWLRDRGTKFAEYERGGVQEYWLIEKEGRRADFYRLDRRGRYRLIEVNAEGIYRSEVVPGFWLRVDWLWQEPLPRPEGVILEIGGEMYARELLRVAAKVLGPTALRRLVDELAGEES